MKQNFTVVAEALVTITGSETEQSVDSTGAMVPAYVVKVYDFKGSTGESELIDSYTVTQSSKTPSSEEIETELERSIAGSGSFRVRKESLSQIAMAIYKNLESAKKNLSSRPVESSLSKAVKSILA